MFFNVGSVFVKLLIGIYLTLANTYDLMIKFTKSSELFDMSKINGTVDSISSSIYTLIAVFMLFRITVTMIQYLIDPDKISDKSIGTGKLITRIIVSIALVIAFPIIMDNVVNPLQEGLLSDDSIIFKIFNSQSSGSGASAGSNNNISSGSMQYGSNKECNLNCNGKCEGNVCKTDITSTEQCIDIIKKTGSMIFAAKAAANYGCKYTASVKEAIKIAGTGTTNKLVCEGPCSPNSYIYDTTATGTKDITVTLKTTDDYDQAISSSENVNFDEEYYENKTLIDSTDGIKFAQSIAASFSDNPEAIYQYDFIRDPYGNKKIATMVEEEEMTYDLFLAIICGIIVVVFMLIICIEVVIRNLKMVVLELLAPIAFISYMNPNDKVLNNWFQKFVGCYLDLFLKLFAVRMGVYFIGLLRDSISGITTILVYIAIFLFIKTVPNLISDIFGIKNMGGTFKDSMNALKTAAFTGAGAVAGAGVGLASGMGKGASFGTVAGGLLGGAFRGAAGGAKGGLGGITKSTSTQRQNNISARESNLNGGNWYQRMLGKVGMDSATRADKDITKLDVQKKKYDEMAGYQKSAEEIAESSNYMKDLRAENDANLANGKPSYSSKELEDMRDKWAGVQAATKLSLDKNDGMYKVDKNGSIWQRQSNGTLTNTGYTYEAGKAAGIASCVVQAESTRHGDRFFNSDKTENSPFATAISSYDDMKTAAKESKKRASQITEQEVAVKHSDSYIAGVASRNNKK